MKCEHTNVRFSNYIRYDNGRRAVTVECRDCNHWFAGNSDTSAPSWAMDAIIDYEKILILLEA